MSNSVLKPGWQWVKFGDVVKLSGERRANPAADGLERYVGLEHLEPNDLRIRRWGDTRDGTTFTNYFKPGQVLFGKRRAYQRKVAVADFEGVCSGDIYVFEPKDKQLLPELLPFICQTEAFFDYAIGTSAGSLSPRTNWKSLAQYEFALPPLEAQLKLVELFGSLEYALEAYKALLIASTHQIDTLADQLLNTHKRIEKTNLSDHFEIASGQVNPAEILYADLPLIAPNHIEGKSGRILEFVSAKDQNAISGKYQFPANTVLYSKIRPNLCKAAISPISGLCSADMYPIFTKETLLPEYLLEILLSRHFTVSTWEGLSPQLQLAA